MSTAIATTNDAGGIEQALIGGDLSKLTPAQRLSYYQQVCQSLELNPLTKPFSYITLNGRLVLYALKDCTDQLRNRRQISVAIAAREVVEDVYVVTARASTPGGGRCDESIGAVTIAGLKGEARANAMMKAETKAKRRVTLSICGLGMLDETELESIPSAAPYVVEAPKTERGDTPRGPSLGPGAVTPSAAPEGPAVEVSASQDTIDPDVLRIKQVRPNVRGAAGEVTLSTGECLLCYRAQIVSLAEQLCQDGVGVVLDRKRSASGNEYLIGLKRIGKPSEVATTPMTDDEIPF